jgi:hypothetical protein
MRVWTQDSGSSAILTADSRIRDEKKSGSGKNIPDHIFKSIVPIFVFKKYLKGV